MRRGWGLLVGLLCVAGVSGTAWTPASWAAPSGATMSLERTELQPGQRITVTLAGWRSRTVNLSVCGNLGRRGSVDCNLTASQDAQLPNGTDPTSTYLFVFAPPTTCPCVVRAASVSQDEVVLAPITLVGVAVGPVVGPALDKPVSVSITARAANRGFVAAVRATLGGPMVYLVSVAVRNSSPETITSVALAGSAGSQGTDKAVSFEIAAPGALGPGETWERVLRVRLPAPMLGGVTWQLTASGAGPASEATVVTHRSPVGLFLLTAIFAADVVVMVWHFTARARARRVVVRPSLALAPAPTSAIAQGASG